VFDQHGAAVLLTIRRLGMVAGFAVAAESEIKRIDFALSDACFVAKFNLHQFMQGDQKRLVMVEWITADNLDDEVAFVVEKPVSRRVVTHLALRKTLNDYFRKCHLILPPIWFCKAFALGFGSALASIAKSASEGA
jgi:hypothetical protein